MKGFIGLLGSLCCLISSLTSAAVPAPIDLFVSDYAQVLTGEELQAIRPIAHQLKTETDVELAVVIVNRVADYNDSASSNTASFEQAVGQWFDTWGIGDAVRNDGILLFVALHDRAVRIELGAGYGHDHDAEMQQIINTDLLPAFKRSDYAKGIRQAVGSLNRFARDWQQVHSASSSWWQRAGHRLAAAFEPLWVKLAGLATLGGIVWQLVRRRLRYRPRNCELCGANMVRLSEVLDDRYLDAGQKIEELLHTVDYDVWRCTSCPHHQIIDYPALIRRHRRCGKCKHLSSEKISQNRFDDQLTTIYQCRHCQHQDRVYTRVSSGNSNGFGGGRSGGGGATGRW